MTAVATYSQADIEPLLRQSLQANVFSNDRNSSPRRVAQLIRELADSFVRYQHDQTVDDAVRAFGQRLASDGIGHVAMLKLIATLHEFIWAHRDGVEAPLSISYSSALLAGYMEEREAYLLKEQERSRLALERVRAQTSH